jgi:hypothetical protein
MEDSIYCVFKLLLFEDLRHCCYVNKLFNKVYYNKLLWKFLCEKDYHEFKPYHNDSYKLGYQLNIKKINLLSKK